MKVGKPKDAAAAKNGTKLARANFLCLMSGAPISGDYIKAEGKAGRMGARLMAIVAEGERGRVYLPPTGAMEAVAELAKPEWKPEGDVPPRLTGGTCVPYGLARWGDLFTQKRRVRAEISLFHAAFISLLNFHCMVCSNWLQTKWFVKLLFN